MKSLQSPFSKISLKAPSSSSASSGFQSLFSFSRFAKSSRPSESSELKSDAEFSQTEESDLDISPEYLSQIAKWDLPDLIKAIFTTYSNSIMVGIGIENDIVSPLMFDEKLGITITNASAHSDLDIHHFPLNLSILAFIAPIKECRAKHEFPFKSLLTAYFERPKKRQTVQRFLHEKFPARVFLQELCTRGLISGRYQGHEFRRLLVHVLALCKRSGTGQDPKWIDESLTLTAIPTMLAFDVIIAQNHDGMQELMFKQCARVEYDVLRTLLQVAPLPCPRRYIGDEISSRLLHDTIRFYETLACNHQALAADEERILRRLQQEARKMLDYDLEGTEFERTVIGGVGVIDDLERETRATASDWAWKESDRYQDVWLDAWECRRRNLVHISENVLQTSLASANHQKWNYVSPDSRERQRIYDMARLLEDGFEDIQKVRALTDRKSL